MKNAANTCIISTEQSAYFAKLIAKKLGISELKVAHRKFKDGESYYRVDIEHRDELMGKDVIVVGSTHTDTDFLELIRVGSAVATSGTRRRIFVVPFYGYSTMERAVLPGEIVTAKENARMLSVIPNHGLGNTFLLLDLHAPEIIHYFEGNDLRFELESMDLLVKEIKKLKLKDPIFASADLGRPLWIESLAKTFNTDIAFISKTRSFEETKVQAVIGDVKGKCVILYDDMVRSGGSLIKAAQAYTDQGAKEIYAVISHLALTEPKIVKDLENSIIKKVITTNSHPMSQIPEVNKSKKIDLVDVSSLFSKAIATIIE